MTATAGHVFVSHSSDNRELANELAAFLEGKGIKIWIAPRDVRPGMDYSEQLQWAIEGCIAFVVLVTEMANKSPYVRAETEMAFSTSKPIFPVRISDIQPAAGLALFLKIRHWTDAYGARKADALNRLTLELQALTAAAAPPAAAPAAAPAPAAPTPAPAAPAPYAQAGGAALMATAAAPAAPPPPLAPSSPKEEERWRAAVGPKADFYIERWRRMEAKNSAYDWNWAACLASLYWFAYRKMWVPMAGLAAAFVVLGLLGTPSPVMGKVTLFLSIGLTFVTGAFGNDLYRKHIAKLVGQASSLDDPAALEQLSRRGGVSVPAMAIAIAVTILLTGLAVAATAIRMRQQGLLEGGNQFQPQPTNQFQGTTPPFEQQQPVDPNQGVSDPPLEEDYPPIDDPAYVPPPEEGSTGDPGDKPTG
ncbi:MAG TPA: TIR domain-containing protein [Allosphingosinicella sp.]|nr:TIR domain-containing protein [Allosphingosinicella sp.]